MTFNKSEEKNFNSVCNNNFSRSSNKCNSKKHLNNPIIKDKDVGGVPIRKKFNHSSWSLSADEDYIVFCFGKDVTQENKEVKDLNLRSSRPVNRKLKYGTDEEQDSVWNIHDKSSNFSQHRNDEHDGASVVHYHHPQLSLHGKERVMVQMGTQKQRDSIKRACHVEGIEESAESRNSDQSESSRSSFAFPVLSWEWIGSPVQMPKSSGLHLRKHKSRAVTFQCWRF
ncbi:uncharacterized protein HKW66_Vig0026370 [Vigna angularis]|nr:protein BREAKING OF ASYMMETRY IN THE STOMATAL LINEAGE [Vigna angularis]KAG2407815.1 uncharacterized protein HKW66_Vig0026370 [Vigna angularis]